MHSIFKRFREPIFVIALLAIPFAIFFVKAKKGRDPNTDVLARSARSILARRSAGTKKGGETSPRPADTPMHRPP